MAETEAWLIDVWETLVSIDFEALLAELAGIGRVPVDELGRTAALNVEPVTIGAMSVADAFLGAVAACGAEATTQLRDEIDTRLRQFLLTEATVFEDTVSFIARSRGRGDLVALVSNCGDDTRPLLEALGLLDLVDDAILSCEIGAGKPGRRIFDYTIATLAIEPSQATLVDDQYGFCEGAVAAGLRAIHLVRKGDPVPARPSAIGTVRSFDEIG